MSATNSAGTSEGIVYRIKSGTNDGETKFRIDEQTGNITVSSTDIDYETNTIFTLVVEAQDRRSDPTR